MSLGFSSTFFFWGGGRGGSHNQVIIDFFPALNSPTCLSNGSDSVEGISWLEHKCGLSLLSDSVHGFQLKHLNTWTTV